MEKAKDDKSEAPPKSRGSRLVEEDVEPDMPPCDAPYLVEYLFEIGPTMAGPMGNGPLTHEEIRCWSKNTGIDLSVWEARTLKQLSLDYLNESHRAKARDCPAPWDGAVVEKQTLSADATKSSIRALASL